MIVDIIMTKKEGFETMRDIMEADAGLKFIFISGSNWYGSEAEFEMARALGVRTLKKLFTCEELLDFIKQM